MTKADRDNMTKLPKAEHNQPPIERHEITPKHTRNSQLHSIPVGVDTKHTASLKCKCEPIIRVRNGHLIVDHKAPPKWNEWSVQLKNFEKFSTFEGGKLKPKTR